MPVNVDTVYQTVQALANKEQRGYLTPQEFNLFANQAQSDIFEQYFYDLNAMRLAKPQQREVGDSVTFLQHKIANVEGVDYVNDYPLVGGTELPPTGHTGKIFVGSSGGATIQTARLSTMEEINRLQASPWHLFNWSEALYFEDGYQRIQVWMGGALATNVFCEHITGSPGLVYWGYIVVNEKAVHNPITSKNFDLHVSEQADLVAKITKLAGISIENQELYQAGAAEEALNTQQENK